jgi:hypothetical protein
MMSGNNNNAQQNGCNQCQGDNSFNPPVNSYNPLQYNLINNGMPCTGQRYSNIPGQSSCSNNWPRPDMPQCESNDDYMMDNYDDMYPGNQWEQPAMYMADNSQVRSQTQMGMPMDQMGMTGMNPMTMPMDQMDQYNMMNQGPMMGQNMMDPNQMMYASNLGPMGMQQNMGMGMTGTGNNMPLMMHPSDMQNYGNMQPMFSAGGRENFTDGSGGLSQLCCCILFILFIIWLIRAIL